MDVLNSMLRVFSRAIRKVPGNNNDESSKGKVAAFGLKKVLDLYHVLLNGKFLTDTGNFFNIQPRNGDRSHPVVALQQVVVEFRAIAMPAIVELWDSNLVESVPDATVKRLLDILKLVSLGEHELQRHLPAEHGVLREIDLAHATPAELPQDPVMRKHRSGGQHRARG